MKKNAVLFYMLIFTAFWGSAQTLDRSRYREITLPQFEAWKQGVPREGTEPALFKARVLFEEISETTISFADPGNQTSIYFTVDKTWPEMEEGRQVTIYFTASGSWSWNRVLDEIDSDLPLAQEPPVDYPDAGGLAYGQYEQDQYDQYGYGGEEEPEFEEFDGWAQDNPPAETAGGGVETVDAETGGEAETGSRRPRQSSAPPSPVQPPPRTARPPVSRTAAASVKITGTAPRPGKVYRLQVGAYTVERNAAGALNRLKEAGFNPNYERHGQYLRVVLSGVRAADVRGYADRIGRAGFTEIWCREER